MKTILIKNNTAGYLTNTNTEGAVKSINSTAASGKDSFSHGLQTSASGTASHAEGYDTLAEGNYSHAEGENNRVFAVGAHVEGKDNHIGGGANYSHIEGIGNSTYVSGQHVEGHYSNPENTENCLLVVGNGTDHVNRSNAMTLDKGGNAEFAGSINGIDLKIGSTSIQEQLYTEQLQTQKILLEGLQLYNSEDTLVVEGDIKFKKNDVLISIPIPTIQIEQIELLYSNWNNGIYDLTEYEGNIILSYDASRGNDEARTAYTNAEISNYGLENKIIALGDIPTVNIPIILKIEGMN